MKLLEIGNTRWKLADLTAQGVAFLGHGMGIKDLLLVLDQFSCSRLFFASVASDAVNANLRAELDKRGIEYVEATSQQAQAGVVSAYSEPAKLGVDRWLALVAARNLNKGYNAVVDAGTAITFDLMDDTGQHLGGWIAPGLHTMQAALVDKTSRVQARHDAPRTSIGLTTQDGLFLGCQAALRGFVGQAHEYVNEHISQRVSWFFAGGGVEYLNLDYIHNAQLRPHLVLEGLAVLARQMIATETQD